MKAPKTLVGGIPLDSNQNKIMLVSSRKYPEQWTLPKGKVEPGETHEEAIIRECYEEAGIRTKVLGSLGPFISTKFKNDSERHVTHHLYTLSVTSIVDDFEWPEASERFTIPEAIANVKYNGMQEALRRFLEV